MIMSKDRPLCRISSKHGYLDSDFVCGIHIIPLLMRMRYPYVMYFELIIKTNKQFLCVCITYTQRILSIKPGVTMRISARNSINGTITSITKGPVNSEVVLDIGNGVLLTSVITTHAVENLGLKEGNTAWAVIKSSEVMIAVD